MRHFRAYIMLAALAAGISCAQKEQEWVAPVTEPEQEPETEVTTYEYRFSLAENETKAHLNDNGVFWDGGDKVGLFLGSAASIAANVDAETTPKTVVFSLNNPISAGTNVYAYYPYQEGNTNPAAATVTIPAVQKGGSISAMPMAGIPFQVQEGGQTSGVISFQNLGAVIDFRIYSEAHAGEQVRSITLTVTDGSNPVSGQGTLDLTRVNPAVEASMAVTWGDSSPSSVTLEQIGTATLSKDISMALGNLYMVVAPGTYNSGTITVTTNAATYTFPFTGKTFNRNTLKRFNMNLDGPNATREAYYTRVQSASEIVDGNTYLIAYINSPTEAKLFQPVLSGFTGYNGSTRIYTGNVVSAVLTDHGILASPGIEACHLTLESTGSSTNYNIKPISSGTDYISISNGSLISDHNATTLSFDNNGGVTFSRKYNNYYNSTYYYLIYSNESFISSNGTPTTLALFKLEGIQLTTPQELVFSNYSFSYSLDGQALPITDVTNIPVLSGAHTQVVYSSSNPAVASVDVSSGALTIQGEGSTRITATAAASDTYAGASVSYRVDVTANRVFRLENEQMAAYLDYMEAHPYDPVDYSYSYVEQYSNTKSSTNRLDLPRPVTLTWTASQSGDKSVAVYYDANHTQTEPMAYAEFSGNSVDIYNLIPNRHYYYVITVGNTEVASGEFNTSGLRRILKIVESPYGNQYANNCRDFGGLETTDGRTLKYGKIFRGTNMDKTTDAQKAYLKNVMHVGLDVDLRYDEVTSPSSEGSNMYNGLGLAQIDASTQNSNTSGTYQGHTRETYNSISDLTTQYKMKATLTRIINAAENGIGVYIHCKVGADRTGFVCLMLEGILGVKQELCDVDYELTSFCKAVDGGDYRKRNDTSKTWYYYPQGIDRIKARSGATFQEKAIDYVVNVLGVPSEKVTAFQNCMLEGTPKQ